MRILVTGRNGQVARSLQALQVSHELVFAARPEFDLADFSSIEACVAQVRPDLVVNAAAYTAVDKAEEEPELAMRINGEAPGVLARAAARIGAPVIQISTDYVFDGSGQRAWREDDRVAPLGAYGRSKAAGEEAVRTSGAGHAILRTAWVYSPFGTNFVKTMLRLADERESITVVVDQIGCPTSAWDIANGIAAVATHWQAHGASSTTGTYHLAGGGEASWADFATAIFTESAAVGGPWAEVTGLPASEYRTRAQRPANSRLDCAKFIATFGYRPAPWRDALKPVVHDLVVQTHN